MSSNPIVEKEKAAEQERREKEAFRYPFQVCCVFQDSNNNDFPIIFQVRDYCNKNHIIFKAREYDIDAHSDDMCIKRLPAFHFYYKTYYDDTQYYDTDPVHKIQVAVWAYEDELRAKERARQRRQERWDTAVSTLKEIFSLDRFQKKPALDPETSLSHDRMRKESEKKTEGLSAGRRDSARFLFKRNSVDKRNSE